jgi:tripartite-type tricarboxylate transporter receptor subunit TctC
MNAIVVGLATLLLAVAVSAQDWPTKPLGIVVPFAPGG